MASVWWRPRPVDPSACRCDVGPEIETGPRGRNMAVRTKLVAGNWKMNGLREDGCGAGPRPSAAGDCGGSGKARLRASDLPAGELVDDGGRMCSRAAVSPSAGRIAMLRQRAPIPATSAPRCWPMSVAAMSFSGIPSAGTVTAKVTRWCVKRSVGAWRAGLIAILCVGETQSQRQAGRAADIVSTQLAGSIPDGATSDNLVVAYEPVWAIGTGVTATSEDITAMHASIRASIPMGARILYGGSVNPQNAAGDPQPRARSTARSSAERASTPRVSGASPAVAVDPLG